MDSSAAEWSEIDKRWNDSFSTIPLEHKIPTVLKIKIIEGTGINRNSYLDRVSYPSPKIEVECDTAKGTNLYRTRGITRTNHPTWNETFRFVLSDDNGRKTTAENVKIRLLTSGWIFSNSVIAETNFDPDSIEIDGYFEGNISFGKMGTVKVRMTKKKKTHLRLSHALCDAEMNFRQTRIPKVMRGMQKLLGQDGAPQNVFETPIISVVGSGGGIRAMTGMCGVTDALLETGLMDCLMYAVGTSGSSWFLTSAYARNALEKTNHEKYHYWLRESLKTSPFLELIKPHNIARGRSVYKAKTAVGQPFTFVDYYGICTAIKAVGREYANTKLSDMRKHIKEANAPLPLLNSSQVHEDCLVQQYYADCSFTPYECEIPQYGVNIDMQRLNSQFYAGAMEQNLPEPDLQFMMGTLGSAFGVSLERIKQAMDFSDDDDEGENGDERYSETNRYKNQQVPQESKSSWFNKLPELLGRNGLIKRTGKILNVVRGFKDMKRFRMNPFVEANGEEEIIDGFDEERKELDLIDGGILCNVAVDAILRPQRRNDILIIIDFTGYDADVDFETLASSIFLAKEGGYKFPPVDLNKIKKEGVKQFYVFEDENDPDCPIVFWLMTTTKHFSQLKDYTPRNPEVLKDLPKGQKFNEFSVYNSDTYDTLDMNYTNLEFDRLCELMEFNVSSSVDIMKQKIREKVMQKRNNNTKKNINRRRSIS